MRTGGPVFPTPETHSRGLTHRNWFATFAPEPSEDDIRKEMEKDRLRNPHNDPGKPPRRSVREIIAELKFQYADAMLEASEKEP